MEGTGGRRRLATILAADVVGYSKLMAQDEEATVRTLRSHREIIDKLIDRHEGRIFNTAGDAVLAEFGSAVEAVRCAISIQDELRVRNAELVTDRQMLLRIGVNVGDVLVEGDDLLGDGVNIAARLEGVAAPGGICISGSTFEQVKNKLSIGFDDLGPQQVKNIPEPIPAYGITTAPVSVKGEPATATVVDSRLAKRRTPLIIAAAIAIVVAAGGIAYWQFSTGASTAVASLPTNISIDEMRAGQIEAFLTGMNVEGALLNGQPFKIALNADKTANYEFAGSGKFSGTTQREIGRWWVEDFRFCMQIRRFARGQQACPKIIKTGQEFTLIRRRTGETLPWRLTK